MTNYRRSPNDEVRIRSSSFVIRHSSFLLCLLTLTTAAQTRLTSPNGAIEFKLTLRQGRLTYAIASRGKAVIEPSPMQFTLDAVDLTREVQIGQIEPYRIQETYPWRGVHSYASNDCNGATILLKNRNAN